MFFLPGATIAVSTRHLPVSPSRVDAMTRYPDGSHYLSIQADISMTLTGTAIDAILR